MSHSRGKELITMELKNGFYTALGTPINSDGSIVESSLRKQIEMQIEYGASGLLILGSMGAQCAITNSACVRAVEIAVDAVKGRLPLFVGVMDNSVERVCERIDALDSAEIEGVVVTNPFYYAVTDVKTLINWYTKIADRSPYPVYMYDLPGVAKSKVTIAVIDGIINHKNIKGMKTADWELIKNIERKYPDADFTCLYSGLDTFDYANFMGIKKNLDGMFCCTPKNGRKLYDAVEAGDYTAARAALDNILLMRNTMAASDIFPAFTHCMNLIGCEGNFHEDYRIPLDDERKKLIEDTMRKIGEI